MCWNTNSSTLLGRSNLGQFESQVLKQQPRIDSRKLQRGTPPGASKHSLGKQPQEFYSTNGRGAHMKCALSHTHVCLSQLVLEYKQQHY